MHYFLQKIIGFCKSHNFHFLLFFVKFRSVPEGGQGHPALPCRHRAGNRSGLPALVGAVIVHRQRSGRTAEPYPPRLCRRNALQLPLPDVGALVLRHEGQHLQNDIAEKGPHKVFPPAGVQKGHVQYDDVNLFLFGQNPPLL